MKVKISIDMVMAIGLSEYNVALFHTVNHAFFKALLFLSAGAVIHSFNDQQKIQSVYMHYKPLLVVILPNSGQFLKLKLQRVKR